MLAGRTMWSERNARAAPRGGGAALVGHHHALDRAEHRDVLVGVASMASTSCRAVADHLWIDRRAVYFLASLVPHADAAAAVAQLRPRHAKMLHQRVGGRR